MQGGHKQLAKVKIAGTLSEWFLVKKGVRQGCVLSQCLFNILAEMVMKKTLDGFQGGLQVGGRMIMNLRYADGIILLATSEVELQELMDCLDRVSRRYSLLVSIDKTKVMASDGIACCILIQNEQLVQVNMFPYLGSLITEDGECTTEFRTRLNRWQAIGALLQKIWKSHSIPISTKITLMKALVWPVATYGCESWTLRRNEETRLEALDERTEKDFSCFMESKKKQMSQFLTKLE